MSAIREAVRLLSDRLILSESIGQAMDDACGHDIPPAWLHVYREQIRAIRQAAEAVELAMNHPEVVD